jgi:hypothetical protein
VDHGIPKSQKIRFLKDKVHLEKMKEIKNYKVEYENSVLLNKITSIMEQ